MTTSSGLKTCTRCRKTKLITQFHYLNAKTAPGEERRRRSDCMECHAKTMREYRRRMVATRGEAYLKSERDRVAGYSDTPQAELRRAAARARHTALQKLRELHPGEFAELESGIRHEQGIS